MLFSRYKNYVKARARSYFLIGADHEDLIQEGMIGLYKAVRDYRMDRQSSFRSFAELCITRQMITAIKSATRQKHMPLNSYISLNAPVYDEENDRTLIDTLMMDEESDPAQLVISQESLYSTQEKIKKELSPYEYEVLQLYLMGQSYQQIAQKLQKSSKSIDNALQRIKRKLEKELMEAKPE